MEESERTGRGREPVAGEDSERADDPNPLTAPGGDEGGIVGTAIGSAEAGAGVGGGDIGRSTTPGDAVGGTSESRMDAPGEPDQEADDATAGMDVAGFARATAKRGGEAGLAGGQGDLGAGGDVAGDFGGLDEEGDEGKPA
jgi:hypothetical protein